MRMSCGSTAYRFYGIMIAISFLLGSMSYMSIENLLKTRDNEIYLSRAGDRFPFTRPLHESHQQLYIPRGGAGPGIPSTRCVRFVVHVHICLSHSQCIYECIYIYTLTSPFAIHMVRCKIRALNNVTYSC